MTEPSQQAQVPELIITDPEAASALAETPFLGAFVYPASPSEVARKLGMPANLAHHHAQKYLRLGLLFEVGREKGRVLYQLAALSFRVPRRVSQMSADTVFEKHVRKLAELLLAAVEKSSRIAAESQEGWTTCTFSTVPEAIPTRPEGKSSEARPAYFIHRTLQLSPERYRHLLGQIDALIQAEESQRDDPRAQVCSVATLAFEGTVQEGLTDSLTMSGYLKLDGES